MSRDDLTEKQARFVQNMLTARTATEAAVMSGYSARTADSQAAQLLKIPKVAEALRAERSIRAKRARVDRDWVMDNLVEVAERCMQAVPVLLKDGTPTGEYSFDSRGATKALELLGREIGMWPRTPDNVQVDARTQILSLGDLPIAVLRELAALADDE